MVRLEAIAGPCNPHENHSTLIGFSKTFISGVFYKSTIVGNLITVSGLFES